MRKRIETRVLNYWYYERDNEIFLDLDTMHDAERALKVLSHAARDKSLLWEYVWLAPSGTKNHVHIVIKLHAPMNAKMRVAWANWMMSDAARTSYVLMRLAHGLSAASLLCTTQMLHRDPDAQCSCTKKHKEKSVTDNCYALSALLSDHKSADYFPRIGPVPRKSTIRLKWGRIFPDQLLNWRDSYGRRTKTGRARKTKRG